MRGRVETIFTRPETIVNSRSAARVKLFVEVLLLPMVFAALLLQADAHGAVVNPFDELDEEKAFRLEEDLVTVASRFAQAARQAPNIVTVVTDREIRERGFLTLADVLRSVPGVYLSTSPESRSLAWFRGVISADNNKILLLVDGVPWHDGIYTHAWLDEYIPLENVRQVEIIKGPGSAIYGTNAFAGVINVVTYKAGELGGGFGRVVMGTGALRGGAVVLADTLGPNKDSPVKISGILRYLDQDGDGLDVTPEGARNINGLDPHRSLNGGLHFEIGRFLLSFDAVDYRHTYFINEQDTVDAVLLESADEFNLNYKNQFITARYRFALGQAVELTPYLYLQHYENPGSYGYFSDLPVVAGKDGSLTATRTSTLVETEKESFHTAIGLDTQARIGLSHHLVGGLGIDSNRIMSLRDVKYESDSQEPDDSTFHLGNQQGHDIIDLFLYGQDTWSVSYWFEATGGLRADYHSLSGLFLSPRAGLLFIPASRTTIKLLYGSAFRAPTARELLVEVGRKSNGENYFTSGNPNLEHERIDTLEAELIQDINRHLKGRASFFVSQVSDEIDKYVEPTATAYGKLGNTYYRNFAGSDVQGAEIEGNYRLDPLDLNASYAFTNAVDKTTGWQQYEFPPHMAHLRTTWSATPGLRLTLLADWYGKRPRSQWASDSNMSDGPAFLLLHYAMATDVMANGKLRADLSVRNLLDTPYETLIYRDQANRVESDGSAKYSRDIEGDGRTFVFGLEGEF